MNEFLDRNNLLEDTQHGSRGGRSTLTQLLRQHDLLVEKLAKGQNIDVTFLDFSKAFDLVDHSILLRKTKGKGFCGKLLSWLRDFLSDRKQCVRVGQNLSSEASLHSGVPQGSVLGPLFFLIFISDSECNLTDAAINVLKYVDDSKMFADTNIKEDVERNQSALNSIYQLADLNNMRWNQSKFQLLHLGNNDVLKDTTNYFAPDGVKIIERKSAVKDLGVMVDECLTYKVHRQKSAKKVIQKLGWIRRTFSSRTIPFLKTLWTSLLQPTMDYGSVLTAPYSKVERRAAENPLRSLTRMSPECKGLSYWERLTKFRLYSMERRYERYKIFYIWKSLNGLVPSLGLTWDGRQGNKLTYPKVYGKPGHARTLQRFSLKWEGVRIYNSLPLVIRKWTGSKQSFKNLLDKFLEAIPDQPEVGHEKPGGRTLVGEPSNSIPDWIKTIGLDDLQDDLLTKSVIMSQTVPVQNGEHDDIYVSNSSILIHMGSGHSPDHSLL